MKKKGFTLMEIILVLGLLTTMVIGLTAVFRPMIATFQKSTTQTDLKEKAQILIEQVSSEMKTAKTVMTANSSINDFTDEYQRSYILYCIQDGMLWVREYPGGEAKPLYPEEFYNGYRVAMKLTTAEKDYDSLTTTVKITLIFNKNGEKYRAETAVECLNIDYDQQNFSVVLSDGYIAIER